MNGARVMTRRQTTEVGDILEAVRQKQKQGSPILRYVRTYVVKEKQMSY